MAVLIKRRKTKEKERQRERERERERKKEKKMRVDVRFLSKHGNWSCNLGQTYVIVVGAAVICSFTQVLATASWYFPWFLARSGSWRL